tara:strand:- start:341 stop:619 length:279 start_codon:yes stop_codon:yes gene_type:complete
MSLSEVTLTDNYYMFVCPHCGDMIIVHKDDVNCAIFRHGQFKRDGSIINPHAPREYCIDIVKKKLIYGCGKPFRLLRGWYGHYNKAEQCDYI